MKNYRTELSQRVRYAIIAGMAGAFLIPQVGFAAPTGEHDYTAGVKFDRNTANTTKITATATNNVINWRDYSVNHGETVQYDGGNKTNNYLNIVTGANTSNINGKIEGGNNVYIVNPNGVIFGKGAEVNVGHLHVSTQDGVSSTAKTAFESAGTSPLVNNATLKADVVNMGKITATSVEVHGSHIRFLNAADVKTSGGTLSSVDMYTAPAASSATDPDGGYAHIGYRTAAAPTNYTVHTVSVNPEYYKLVKDKAELDAINTDITTLAGNYMLEQDIDLGGAEHTPIGGNGRGAFTGKFDGNFFRVQNFNISNSGNNIDSAGLFGEVSNARIENLGVSQATIKGKRDNSHCYAGGLAGHTSGTSILKNVYATETTKVEGRRSRYGGIVGSTGSATSSGSDHTVIDSAYSKAVLGRDNPGTTAYFTGGGIVGHSGKKTDISNSYSSATNTDGTAAYFLYIADPDDQTTIKNSYGVVGTKFSSNDNALSTGAATNTYKINGTKAEKIGATGDKDAYASKTYSDSNWSINNDGAPGAKWRIYEGRTLPLLTAFMNGRVDSVGSIGANYSYRKFNQKDGFAVAGDANKDPISNNHADITGLTYDSKIVKIVDGAGNVGNTSNVTYDKTLDTTTNKIYTYEDTATPLNTTDNIRNAGTKAMLWSDQDGPNLRNVNVTINKRSVTVENSNITVTRRYNGKLSVKDQYNAAIRNGGITAGGITPEDIADGSVTITTSADFDAVMDDKNVGKNKAVTLKGSLTFGGSNQSNYAITQSDFNFGSAGRRVENVATITKAPLILKVVKDSTTKVYDGTDAVTDATMKADPNIKLDDTLHYNNETDPAAIQSDDANKKDDVSINYNNIGSPTYIKSDGSAEVHAGTHKIRYKNVELQGNDRDNYELYYQMPNNTQTKVENDRIDLNGTITPRGISTKDFKVYKTADHSAASAERVYDGTDSYTPGSDVYLSSNVGASTAPDTGIVDRDRNKITFGLVGDKAYFTKDDNATKTSHVSEAKRITYNIKAATTDEDAHRLSDYYYTVDGTTKVGELTDAVVASGEGRITPKALTAEAKKDLNKIYDGMAEYTDGSQNVKTGDNVVTFTGWTSDSDKRTNDSKATYVNASNVDDANVAYAGTAVTKKNIKYTAKLTGRYADDYAIQKIANTVISTATNSGTENVAVTADLGVEVNAGTISPRDVKVTFKNVTKVYDGTANNNKIEVDSLDDKLSGRVFAKDGTNTGSFSTAGITSRYGTKGTPFVANVNASDNPYDVEYANISNPLGGNYRVDSTLYGTGTITRRLIEKSGFQVRDKDGNIADATKVYDGTSVFALKNGETLVAKTAATGSDTGVVDKDKDNIYFTMTGENGHFTSDAAGANRTSHKSEANHVAYNVIARTKNEGVSPLSNYEFGTTASKRNLENVNAENPDAVTAKGAITPAKIQAQTKEISKVYDGMAEHTDGNRNVQHGDKIVGLNLIADPSGQPTNTSTAAYADKNVARDTDGTIIKKAVNYTAQLTGKYADDYEIVDAGNNVISSVNGTGDSKTVTATRNNVANMGTITPRKLNIKMGDVTKTYDGTSANASATVTGITDDPTSTVINTILSGDSITAGTLQTTYRGMLTANTASSNYGRLSGTNFNTNANASNGTPHDVQYANMDDAFRSAFSAAADNYDVDENVYSKGTINRKAITPNTFKVSGGKATKVYDGTSAYTVPAGSTLTANTGELVGTDASKIQFAISGNGAKFMKTDGVTETANVADARKVAYNITATGDADTLRNYTLNGQNLESGNLTASGDGEITRRALNLNLVQSTGIDKEYDGQTTLKNTATKNWNALTKTDSAGNVQYATGSKELVNDGTKFNITSNYMNDASTPAPDKNVKRVSGNVADKNIQYNISITGGDANNYSFDGGTSSAAGGLKLSATGTITPKDLSGALKKVTKAYDGTKNVPASQVGLESGINGVVSGDRVNLATHTESYQSENVNGDGTTETIGGTAQKNWVNYSNLTLGGTDAGNYTLASTAKGLGEITPYELNDGSITFTKTRATKVYDGTRDVKWTDGSSTTTDQKKYITSATVTVGSAPAVDILGDLKLEEAKYDTKDVDGGSAANRVTYRLSYTDRSGKGNFSLGTGVTSFTTKGDGIITKKDVTATVRNPLSKTYDATTVVKNAAGNVITGSALNDQVSLSGLTGNDGATYTTTAVYADKNAGTGKTVKYTLAIDGANAGNYNLKYNGADNNGNFSTTNNTITKRKVDVTFAPVSKSYDGTPTNTSITPSVSATDAAVLREDSSANVSGTTITGLTGVTSQYGTGTTDATFAANPNAGTNKSVQYAGIGTAMGTAFGANNYEFATNGYGKGTITKANINTSDITFATTGAHKVYDGTRTVKYNGSSAKADVKNYITTATANLGGGHTADLRGDLVIDEKETRYVSADAGTNIRVKYKFRLNNSNIEISGKNEFEMYDKGTIDRRVLNLDLAQKSGIDKIYDANANLVDTNARHYDKFVDDDALGNVTYAAGATNDNKLVRTSNGAEVNDGAAMTIRTNYVNNLASRTADKNVARDGSGNVTTKDISYRVSIDGAAGSNYQISYNGTTANAEDGLNLSATGTITPRAMTLGFADVDKPYDTTATNNTKTINSVTAGNSDGRGAATLAADGITSATFGSATGSVNSLYGAGDTDATFHRDPNVVVDSNGNVVERGKDVQYTNVRSVLTGALANNYTVADTAYGKGTIRKRSVTANDFRFNITNATKMYDGTKDVEYVENGQTYKDLAHVKKRFRTSKLDLGGGNLVDINLDDIELTGAAYNDERVAHANGVNYDVTINTKNFEFNGARTRRIQHTGDTITKRDLATKLPPHLVKEYDGEQTFTETNETFANAMAKANLTGVVDRDKNKIQLKVTGTYSSPDASAETREEAEARTPATAGRNVAYELTLSGDADTLSNYKIGSVETLDANGEMKGIGSGKADIYKKTLTVSVAPIDKAYDGTRTVVRPNGTGTLPHPDAGKLSLAGFVNGEGFAFDQTAANEINGLYSDPNVSRENGVVVDKNISYSGIKNAFKNYADNHAGGQARNYRVDSDTATGVGKILPRQISSNDITNGLAFAEASKVYDGTRAVKHGGLNTPDALRNYLTSATVNIDGTDIDIKNDLTIRADEASTHYDTPNVAGGAQPRVTYTLNYIGGNFDITGPITKTANGVITKRQVTAYALGQLTKQYDGTRKVFRDPTDPHVKTYYRGAQVETGDSIVRMEAENGDRGLLASDGVQNVSTATFADKKAGTGKTVNYNVAVDGAHAGNYELVDQRGNVISQTSTNNNTITPRRLDITFGDVSRAYDGTSTNTDVTALVKDADARATMRRDGVNPLGEQLILRDSQNRDIAVPSDYGYGRTDSAFTPDADANQTGEPAKDVQYRKLGDAMRTLLGNDADNYDFDETGYGKGTITKAKVRESDFRLKFGDAVKEYDGTDAVNNAQQYLDKEASRMRLPRNEGEKPFARLQDKDISTVTGTYQPLGSVRSKDASENNRGVQYRVQLSNRNFDFENGWDGAIFGDGAGKINRRAITLSELPKLTKVYDGTRTVANTARDPEGNLVTNGDTIVRFRHATDATKSALIAGDDVTNASTATYGDANVAWQDNAWKNGDGTVADKDVDYNLKLSGTDAANYKIVDEKGNEIASTTRKTGRITPKEIHLKSDPQTRWINEGLPDSYTGTPTGKGYKTGVGDEALPGEIYYNSPDGRLHWGDYQINGYYRASDKAQYQRPDGTRYQLADGTPDGDSVVRNYRFVQNPANATALHIGPYVPNTDYYQALTQTSKMLPDEYAYENASLDRRSHFGRDPEAEISYEPPSLNMVKDGVDISKNGIEITDETVFRLVNEVFGA
ncbi:filamentous hemagglutinin [Selenomonas sp. oral taxon 126]|uniref:YDG domain-containing protein n=1 Tax=Selenomonas sp. oral taxon 126 TaxID=712528 RepID=UPI00080773C2|nr:YDG domain-containing protein [Selenomonas sp. oral taxon 126]ANR70668.1 filamentous hemagglutinin [Selenomonas sp. oral taxon 126]